MRNCVNTYYAGISGYVTPEQLDGAEVDYLLDKDSVLGGNVSLFQLALSNFISFPISFII